MIKFWKILDFKNKIKIILLFLCFFIVGFFDVITVASIPVILTYVLTPEIFLSHIPNDNLKQFFENYFEILSLEQKIIYSSQFIILVFVLKNIITYSIYFFESTYLKNLKIKMQSNIFFSYINKTYLQLNNTTQGKIKSDYDFCHHAVSYIRYWLISVKELIIIFGLFFALFLSDKKITLTIISFLPIFLILQYFLSKKLKKWGEEIVIHQRNIINYLGETLDLAAEIFVLSKEKIFFKRFLDETTKREMKNYFSKLISYFYKPFFEVIFIIFLFGSIYYFYKNDYTINEIIPLITIIILSFIRIMPSIYSILISYNGIKFFEKSAEVVIKKFKNQNFLENQNKNNKNKNFIFNKSLKVKNLKFKFLNEKKSILSNINLQINKNDKVAILGKNGSGKTTLINILAGLYPFSNGELILDGKIKIKSTAKFSWDKMGYFRQNSPILDANLTNNITFFHKPEQEKIKRILNLINDKKNFHSFGKHLKKHVEEDNSKFSGGQKQLIGLGRTFYTDTKLIFLDEPTNNLDHTMKKRIVNYLKNLDTTLIIITHDKSIINICNKLITIENGRVKNIRIKK